VVVATGRNLYFSDVWAGEVGLTSYSWAGPVIGPRAEIAILPWSDGGAPLVPEETERVLDYALKAAQVGRFVELGCHAGHGRTGTALAAVMIMAGRPLKTAVNNVWDNYCELAIETRAQELYLLDLADRLATS
jgi:protein-tyrosine phosphatase